MKAYAGRLSVAVGEGTVDVTERFDDADNSGAEEGDENDRRPDSAGSGYAASGAPSRRR